MTGTKFFWFAAALTVLAGCGDPKRMQALEEIRTLETKRGAFERTHEQLKKFKVIHSQLIMREQEFNHKQPIIVLTVKNETEQSVSRAYFEATLAGPDRSDPRHKDRFNYIISGGLEPGEEATWYLELNMFSVWATLDAPADAALTVTVEKIDGAGGTSIFVTGEFTERDRTRLDELKKKYGVEQKHAEQALPGDDRKAPLSVSNQKNKDKNPDVKPEAPGEEKKIEAAPQISARAENSAQEAPAPAAAKPAPKAPLYQPPVENKTPPPAPVAAKPAGPAAAQPSKKASEPIIYRLQLGSFKNKNAASSFSRSLAAKGYKPNIVKIAAPDKGITYRVRLGKFKNLKDARKMVAALAKKEGISAIIIAM